VPAPSFVRHCGQRPASGFLPPTGMPSSFAALVTISRVAASCSFACSPNSVRISLAAAIRAADASARSSDIRFKIEPLRQLR
jgi:hypothetical protein